MDTLVYTSAQWRSTSLLNKIIQAGVLCAEIENDYKVKLKIGNGKDRWVDLPYIPELSGYYTKEEIDSFNVVINNKISELEADKHTHDNKEILDKITKEFTIEDKEKLDSITPYDDKEVNKRLTALEKDSHTHKNKSLLDKTTAVFTTEYEYIITHMETYDVFVGATATKPGTEGLVPAPKAGDNEKFLRGDGNWVTVEGGGTYVLPPATRSTLGGVKVGNNINVDANGVISVTFPPIPEPPEPYVLPIASASTLGGIKVGDGLSIDGTGTLSATGIETIPPATTTTIGGVIVGDGISVENDGTISVTQYQAGVATEIIPGESVDIPNIYQRVEYIQSDTTQYIDTGYTQRSGSCFRIEVCPLQDPNLQSTQQVIFGNYVTTYNTQSYQVCWYMNDQNIYQFAFGISNTTYPAYTYFTGYYDQDIVAHVYNDTIEIYDSTDENLLIKKTLNQSIGNGANTIAIFCKHVDDHYDSKSKIKLRRFSIYSQLNSQNEFDDQYLVMDMYPVVRISDNVAGLYDVITETFFSSPVGNDFIVGPDLYADTRINVKYNDGLDVNSNNELINTGVLDVSLNESDNTVLDVEFMDETTHIQLPTYDEYSAGTGIEFESTSSRLPAAYQEIEWAESTFNGGQYINTQYRPNGTSRFVTKALMYNDYSVFGCYRRYNLTGSGSTLRYYTGDSSGRDYNNRIDLIPHVYDIGGTYVMLDDEVLDTFTQSSYQATDTMFLFGRSDGSQLNDFNRVRIYYFKIYDYDTLIRDYVPCYRKSDNVVGLYDLVYDVFYTTPTGSFTAGPDVSGGGDGTYVINNTGVLDVSLNQSDNTILDIEFADETKHIQLPSGGSEIIAGEGINVSHDATSVDVPVYLESFVIGDINTSTGVPIPAPDDDILRINDFIVRVDDDRTSATVNIYDTNHVALLWKMFFYQADGTFISVSGSGWSQNDDSITIPTNAKWIKIITKYLDNSAIGPYDLDTCVIKLTGSVVDVISIQKATDETLGGVRVGDYLVADTTGRLSVDPNLIQRIETMEEHDISDTDSLILNVVE